MKNVLLKKILIAFAGFIFLLLLVVQSPAIGGKFSYLPMMLMPAIITAVIMVIATFIYDRIKKTNLSLSFLLLLIVLLGAFWGGLKIVDKQIATTKERSRQLIDAMDKYYDSNNKYPEKLEQLSPAYIAEVPNTGMGIIKGSFEYKPQDNYKDYWLSFEELFNTKWIYVKSRETWIMDD
jgi:predicted PurR-regulated permease PerM